VEDTVSETSDERSWTLIERCGYAAAALAVLPIPFSETVGVTAVHVSMVVGIARIHGIELERDSAVKLVLQLGTTVGVSYVGTRVAIGLAKLVFPILPGLVGAPLVFASTMGLGAVAKAHFASPDQELTDEEVRNLYRATTDKAKARFDPTRARSDDAKSDAEALATPVAVEPPPVAAPTPTPTTERALDRLERLRRLRDEGFLGAAEFEAASKKVLEE
jgi:uncharacterized protein (DUF697 family)